MPLSVAAIEMGYVLFASKLSGKAIRRLSRPLSGAAPPLTTQISLSQHVWVDAMIKSDGLMTPFNKPFVLWGDTAIIRALPCLIKSYSIYSKARLMPPSP